jgi:hypothetical protein
VGHTFGLETADIHNQESNYKLSNLRQNVKINLLNMYIHLHSCVICMKPGYEFYVCLLGSFKLWTVEVGMLEVGQRIGLQGDKESRLRQSAGKVARVLCAHNPGIFTTFGNTIFPFRRTLQSEVRHKRPVCVCVCLLYKTNPGHACSYTALCLQLDPVMTSLFPTRRLAIQSYCTLQPDPVWST